MKFSFLIATVAAVKVGGPGSAYPWNTPGGTTDAGSLRNPPINKHSEVMYNITHPLPQHQHTIPVNEWDVSESNFGTPYTSI